MRYHPMTTELIRCSGRKARDYGHSYVGSAHLLVALVGQSGEAGQLLRGFGMDPELVGAMTQLLYGAGKPDLPLPQGLTEEARAILRTAAREAKHQNCREIRPIHVLMAMARQAERIPGNC